MAIENALEKCTALYGDAEVIDRDPFLYEVRDAFYVPLDHVSGAGGIFDVSRRLVMPSAYFHGPHLEFGVFSSPLRYSDIVCEADADVMIYGGFLHGHFGHFLLSTFSRF